MLKIWNLTKSYLRKGKGQIAIFFIIIIITTTLMNIGLLVWRNYDNNFITKANTSNRADVALFMQENNFEVVQQLKREMTSDSRTKQVETRSILFANSEFNYGKGTQNRFCAILNRKDIPKINQITFIDQNLDDVEKPVYLPYIYHTGGNYQLGDAFSIKLTTPKGSFIATYTVAGFYEETFVATINSTICSILLEDSEYETLAKENEGVMKATYVLAVMEKAQDAEAFMSDYYNAMEKRIAPKLMDTTHYDIIKQARTVTSSIGSLLVVAFSLVIMVVSLIIVKFHIRHTIAQEIVNMGILKALGYTSYQIVGSLVLQFLLVGGLGSLLGITISYQILPWFSQLLASQTGLVWVQGIDMSTNSLCLFIVLIAIIVMALSSSKKVLSLHPIMALRGGLKNHNFKRNILRLDKTRGNLTLLLATKQFFQDIRHYLGITLVIILASFTACFAGILYSGATWDKPYFANLFGGEIADIQAMTVDINSDKEVIEKIESLTTVEKAIYYKFDTLTYTIDASQVMSYITENFDLVNYQGMIYAGRFPKYDNEVALGGALAKAYGKSIGELVVLSKNGQSYEYLITGLIQGSNFLGHDACLTQSGYNRIAEVEDSRTINIYVKDKSRVEETIKIVEDRFGDNFSKVHNVAKEMEGSTGPYASLIIIITTIIAVVTMIIISLILYMIIKTTIVQNKKPIGIQKAIGYTDRQLMLQIALNFLPVLFIGTSLGSILGYIGVNPLLSLLFFDIGIIKVQFMTPITLFIAIIIAISSIGFGIGILASFRIKKISPYTLMSE